MALETLHDWWPLLSALFVLNASPFVTLCFVLWRKSKQQPRVRSVAVVVLGDIGRSPRMMYHADSFAQAKFDTWIIGYRGSRPIPSLRSMRYLYVSTPPLFLSRLPRLIFPLLAPWKVAIQTLSLFNCLLFRMSQAPEFIIVQNPPSIPTLAVVQFVAFVRHSKLIIDWHNTGYSILALRLGMEHTLVKLARLFEGYFGRTAHAHLFVTNAMKDALVQQWNLQGEKVVLHDRPPAHFHPCDPLETHDLFVRLFKDDPEDLTLPDFLPEFDAPQSTPFTQVTSTPPSGHDNLSLLPIDAGGDRMLTALRDDRPVLLVSSTSWTPDERFDILLDALAQYEAACRASSSLPKVLMVVTGRGPMRAECMARVRRMEAEQDWRFVRVRSLWLEAEDYPRLLGAADLGISMHESSSGLDLPMKVVDMFGCGLPVCALRFACLDELVHDGVNGRVFGDAGELATQLTEILSGYPRAAALERLRANLARQRADAAAWGSWSDNWAARVRPLVLSDFDNDEKRVETWLEKFAEQHASEESLAMHAASPTAIEAL